MAYTGRLGTTYSQLSGIILGTPDEDAHIRQFGLAQAGILFYNYQIYSYAQCIILFRSYPAAQAEVTVSIVNYAPAQSQAQITGTYYTSGIAMSSTLQTYYGARAQSQALTVYRAENGAYIWPKFGQAQAYTYILPVIRFEDDILNAQTVYITDNFYLDFPQLSYNFTVNIYDPQDTGRDISRSGWLKFVFEESGMVRFALDWTTYDSYLAIYTGNSAAYLTLIGYDDSSALGSDNGMVFINVVAGTTYWVQASSYSSGYGEINFNVTYSLWPFRKIGQSRAWVYVADNFSYSQAQVTIGQVQQTSNTQTHIISIDVQTFSQTQTNINQSLYTGQANTDIRTTYQNWGQSQALVGLFTYILKYVDTFSRVTTAPPFNLGNADVGQPWFWNDYTYTWPKNQADIYVDGSSLILPNYIYNGTPYGENICIFGPPITTTKGEVYFDYWLAGTYGSYDSYITWIDRHFYLELYDNGTAIQLFGYDTSITVNNPVRNSWYRVRAAFDRSGPGGVYTKVKIWKVGDVEPEAWTTVQTSWSNSVWWSTGSYEYTSGLVALRWTSPNNESGKIDNIYVYNYENIVYGIAQGNAAVAIYKYEDLKQGQAQATINITTYIGQAAVKITNVNWIYYDEVVANDAPSAWYTFDIPTNATLIDKLGNYTLPTSYQTPFNLQVSSPVSPNGTGIQFANYGYYSTSGVNITPIRNNGWAHEFWIKPNNPTERFHIRHYTNNGAYIYIGLGDMASNWPIEYAPVWTNSNMPGPGNSIFLTYSHLVPVIGYNPQFIYTPPVDTNAWHHVVATLSSDGSKLSLYLDGSLVQTKTLSNYAKINWTGGTHYFNLPSSRTREVQLDEYVLYDHELNSGRVYHHYSQIMGGYSLGYAQACSWTVPYIDGYYVFPRWAQAQADIQQTFRTYSQAQTSIRKSAGLAQAQSKVSYATDTYSRMIKNDGASNLYGFHISNAYPNSEYTVLKDELGIVNTANVYQNSPYTAYVASPVSPERYGINFNSTSNYVNWATNSLSVLNNTTWTIETWVLSPSTSTARATIWNIYNYNGTYNMVDFQLGDGTSGFTAGNKFVLLFDTPSYGTWYVYNTGVTYTPNTWYHTAVVYNYTAGTFKIYINGQLATTVNRSWAPFTSSNVTFYLHNSAWYSTNAHILGLDNLALYPIELSQDKIIAHYNLGNIGGLAQAQAIINRSMYVANADAFIDSDIWIQFGNTQAYLTGIPKVQGQAQVYILPGLGRKSGNAQTMVIPFNGLLRYYKVAPTGGIYTALETGILDTVSADTDVGQINLGTLGTNYAFMWQAWFTADMSGSWFFNIPSSDDGSAIYIYNELNQSVGTINANYGGGTGSGSGYITLTQGVKYKIVVKYAQGGGPALVQMYYRRPNDTADMWLNGGFAPWNNKTIKWWSFGQANALPVQRNGDWYIWPQWAQANARIQLTDLQKYSQALVQVGYFWPGLAIAQILNTEDMYRLAVLADKPNVYYPMDEYTYGGNAYYSATSIYSGSYLPEFAADGNTNDGWASLGYAAGLYWQVSWGNQQTIQTVKITNRPNYAMGSGRILYSDGTSYNVTFPATSRGVITYTAPASNVLWMRLISDSGGYTNPGFGEVEAFNGDATNLVRFPVITGPVPPTEISTIVGRENASWDGGGAIFSQGSATLSGTSISFKGTRALAAGKAHRLNSAFTVPLTIPGYQGQENNMNVISPTWWGVAGDIITIHITTPPTSNDIGIYQIGGENQWWSAGGYQTTSGLVGTAGTDVSFTLTSTGPHHVYLWTYNAAYTGTGTVTAIGRPIDPLIPTAVGAAITVETWFKWDGTTDYRMLIGFHSYDFYVRNGNIGFNASNGVWETTTTPIVAGVWYHVAGIMYNRQAFSIANKIYVNGVLQSLSGTDQTGWFQPYFSISGWSANTNYRLGGTLDEYAIFDHALTAEQILAHYKSRIILWNAQAQAYCIETKVIAQAMTQVGGFQFSQTNARIIAFNIPYRGQANTLISRNGEGHVRVIWHNASLGDAGAWANGPENWIDWNIEDFADLPNYTSGGPLLPGFPGTNGGAAWTTRFTADATGTWDFSLNSDDGSELYINSTRVVDNSWGGHFGERRREGSISLVSGTEYNFHARWGQGGGPYVIRIQYRRPTDGGTWYYLTQHNPPWLTSVKTRVIGQAQVEIASPLHTYVSGQVQAYFKGYAYGLSRVAVGHFQYSQAGTAIKATYNQYATSKTQVGGFQYSQAQGKLNAFNIQKYLQAQALIRKSAGYANAKARITGLGLKQGQARAVTLPPTSAGLAQTNTIQTYPLMSMDINYALPSYGATATDRFENVTASYTIDGNDLGSAWLASTLIEVGAGTIIEIEQWLRIDLSVNRTINFFRIVPVTYNAIVSLQYLQGNLHEDPADDNWITVRSGLQFNVDYFDTPNTEGEVHEEIVPHQARYWRLYVEDGGDWWGIGILTFELGWATIKSPTFAQAQAFFGHMRTSQAQVYVSPSFDVRKYANTNALLVNTYQTYAQTEAYILIPTFFGLANANILQTYQPVAQADAWILIPTAWAAANARIIKFDIPNYAATKTAVRAVYWGTAHTKTFITKRIGHGQANVHIRSVHYGKRYGLARVRISNQWYSQSMAWILKGQGYAQATANIYEREIEGFGQARTAIKLPPMGLAQANIRQTYQKYSQAGFLYAMGLKTAEAQAGIIQIYRKYSQNQGAIRQVYQKYSQASVIVRLRYKVCAQAQTLIHVQRKYSGLAMAWLGYHQLGLAQAQLLSYNVPKFGQAVGYISVGPSVVPVPLGPSSDYATYLVYFNNDTLPGYAQTESYDSNMNMVLNSSPYIDASLSEYIGLQNKIISLGMLLWEDTYEECKVKLNKAATIIRTPRGFSKLYIQNNDKYYLAIAKSITTSKSVPESPRTLLYNLEFEAKPWLISNEFYSVQGTGAISTVGRILNDGGWTPATVLIMGGTNVSITGTSADGQSVGTITLTGTFTETVRVDTETFMFETLHFGLPPYENAPIQINKDFSLYVGPGVTNFTVTGATNCIITWNNRWYL